MMGEPEITGIFPKVEPCTDCPESELAVYRRIKEALPAGWTAWHSLKIRTKGAEFSESDFVIANPDRGILALEVKGGRIEKEGGVWLQNGQPMKSSPLSQAHRFVRVLLGKFKDKGLFAPPIGVAAVFPDTDFDAQPTQGDLEGLIIGARDLPYLEEALPRILERALREHTGRLFSSPGWVGTLHGLWCESWPLGMSLSQVVKGREARRIQLDKEQFIALEGILENDLVFVRGGAGTGKTLLARELAIREARAGRRVLLLTFTEALGRELAAHIDLPGIAISPVGLYALGKLRENGFDEPERYDPEFWDAVTRLTAESGGIWDGCRFDTVIIDEGQDFGDDEWEIVKRCAGPAERPRIWIFADEKQAFWENRRIPAELEMGASKYALKRPYRCPPGVQALADAYVEGGWGSGPERLAAVAQGLEDGTLKVVSSGDTEAESHAEVGREIRAAKKAGFAESDIAVVSLRGLMYPGNLAHSGTLGRCELAKATDLDHRDRVICDTFLRYKGLERRMVIIGDVSTEASRYPVRMNIAASRAYGALRVVASRREIYKDPILKKIVELAGGGK